MDFPFNPTPVVTFNNLPDDVKERHHKAVARQDFIRATALVDITDEIAGYEVKQMELIHLIYFDFRRNPLLIKKGEVPTPDQLAIFLWVISPKFCFPDSIENKLTRWNFMRRCQKDFFPKKDSVKKAARFAQVVASAREYVVEQFIDAEFGSSSCESYYHWSVSAITAICRNFGETIQSAQRIKVKLLFQLLREIRAHKSIQRGERPKLGNNLSGNTGLMEICK